MSLPRKHILISGTGRAGTTFLVGLLTRLGFDTGFRVRECNDIFDSVRCGLEHDPFGIDNWPKVVKSALVCMSPDKVIDPIWDRIELMIIPIRDPVASAESRREIQRLYGNANRWPNGGLSPFDVPEQLEAQITARHYSLVLCAAKWGIPMLHLHYPRLVKDLNYLYEQFSHTALSRSWDAFEAAFHATCKPGWIHCRSEVDQWQPI